MNSDDTWFQMHILSQTCDPNLPEIASISPKIGYPNTLQIPFEMGLHSLGSKCKIQTCPKSLTLVMFSSSYFILFF